MTGARGTPFRITDGLAALALLVVTAFSSLRQEDVRFWDESLYLERGLSLSFGAQPGWEWNPLYADMYWLLGRIFTDPIDLYFAGRVSTAFAIVLAVWLSLRLFVRPWMAFTGALVMSALPIAYVWPGVSSPSAGFLIVAVAIAWRWRTPAALVGASALTWLAAATRPEFVWAALAGMVVLASALGVWAFRGKAGPVAILLIIVGLIAPPTVLTMAYGNPVDLGSRSWEAFEQHYEFRFATDSDDPWQIDADVAGRDFPGAASIPSAATTNPSAFAIHVAKNSVLLPFSVGGHFAGLGGSDPIQNLIGVATALIWIAALLLVLLRSPRDALALIKKIAIQVTDRSSRITLILTLVIVGFSLISTFVIYPRPHYLVFLVASFIVMTGFILDRLGDRRLMRWLPVFAITAVSSLALIGNALFIPASNSQLNAQSLRIMNERAGPWILLTPERPIDIYLANGQQILQPSTNVTTFDELLRTNNINAIFDGILLRKADYAQLEGFDAFIEDPEAFGFRSITPDSPFLVRGAEVVKGS